MAYDISEAFEAIENELINSMMRNFSRHRAEETELGYNWAQWQAEELKSFELYKKRNASKFGKRFTDLNNKISDMLIRARADGNTSQEEKILKAIQNGFKLPLLGYTSSTGEFFKLNDRKLDALINATTNDLQRAETAILRMSNDKYRQVVFNAQVYANTGAGTYEKAIDMACHDMLNAGLNCVEYRNGARHTLPDYAEMVLRTANKRAYLYGEGEKRREWGITTVVVNSRQGGCPDCAQYIGRVFIDDVYSGGKQSDGKYPLLSKAIAGGLFHPRCKDSTSTYYKGITTLKPVTPEEIDEMKRREQFEHKQQYAERQKKRFDRIAKYSLDPDNKRIAQARADEWGERAEILSERVEKFDESSIMNYARAEDLFSFSDYNDYLSPQAILDTLENNEIGKETIKQLSEKNVKPILIYEPQSHTYRGEQRGNTIKIFLDNIPSIKVAAQTIVHETTHLYYGIGQSQWAEAVCLAKEKMFLTQKPLTWDERKYIVKLSKEYYPEFNWKKGGYGHKR